MKQHSILVSVPRHQISIDLHDIEIVGLRITWSHFPIRVIIQCQPGMIRRERRFLSTPETKSCVLHTAHVLGNTFHSEEMVLTVPRTSLDYIFDMMYNHRVCKLDSPQQLHLRTWTCPAVHMRQHMLAIVHMMSSCEESYLLDPVNAPIHRWDSIYTYI